MPAVEPLERGVDGRELRGVAVDFGDGDVASDGVGGKLARIGHVAVSFRARFAAPASISRASAARRCSNVGARSRGAGRVIDDRFDRRFDDLGDLAELAVVRKRAQSLGGRIVPIFVTPSSSNTDMRQGSAMLSRMSRCKTRAACCGLQTSKILHCGPSG